MTPGNLGVCFGPTLCHGDDDLSSMDAHNAIVQGLVEHFASVFAPEEDAFDAHFGAVCAVDWSPYWADASGTGPAVEWRAGDWLASCSDDGTIKVWAMDVSVSGASGMGRDRDGHGPKLLCQGVMNGHSAPVRAISM